MMRWVVTLLAFAVVVLLHRQVDRAIVIKEGELALPSLEAVRLACGGYERFASDLYWLGFIQYCGDADKERGGDFAHAYDYVNLITGLDPFFIKPYWFGCWAVGYWQRRPDLADKILQRGIKDNPETWEIPYMAGINEYLFAKNYKAAARYYKLAGKLPGAPDFLIRQADILERDIPVYIKQQHLLFQMYHTTKDPNLKASVYAELMALLEQMYKASPTTIMRNSLQQQIDDLKRDYERYCQEP